MMKIEKLTLKKADMILIMVIISAATVLWLIFSLGLRDGEYAVVYINGEEWGRFELERNAEIEIPVGDGYNILVIRGGKADVIDADCPDRTCVFSHAVDSVGQTIVCLPHRMTVVIEGRGESDVDIELR